MTPVTTRVRAVHVITRMILGGAQEDALLTLIGLRETGSYEVGLVTGPETGSEGELLSEARALGIPVRIVPEMRRAVRPVMDFLAAAALRRLLAEMRPDVVQSHSSKAGVLARWAGRRARVPVVVHRIHGLAFHPCEKALPNCLYRLVERTAAPFADKLVSVADALTRRCLEAGVGRPEQFVTIPTGMDVRPYLALDEAVRARVRRDLGFAPHARGGDVVFVKIARLVELKGHAYVMRAAREVLRSLPGTKLLFVGDGPLREKLERDAGAMLPPGTVRFTGLVPPERIPGLLAASDVLVHTSLREGLPRVLVQAHLASRPVVSFDLDGAPEIVEDGASGRLVAASGLPRSDVKIVEELARAMVELGSDAGMRAEFGKRGRALAVDRFSAGALVRSTDMLYRELLGRKRHGLAARRPAGGVA